jgi:UDP-glucose 4-epimerase
MRTEPRSVYAISRLASEHIAASRAAGAYELLVLRLTNTVGAPDHPSVDPWSLLVNDLCRQATTSGTLELRSDGLQWRDFVPLATVCDAIAFACEPSGPTLAPGTYDLGSGRPRTVRSVAELIQDTFERETGERPPMRAPAPSGPAPEPYHVSVQRAADQGLVLGDPLEPAILETVRFCLDHREELTS